VSVRPGSPESSPPPRVVERLADEFAEAAASADYAGDVDLARVLADRVEVLRWADSRTIRSAALDR
jgi:hypothetical protein